MKRRSSWIFVEKYGIGEMKPRSGEIFINDYYLWINFLKIRHLTKEFLQSDVLNISTGKYAKSFRTLCEQAFYFF